jgi:hypothetical protein
MGRDSNPRDACAPAGFQDRCLQPLGHPSFEQYQLLRRGDGRTEVNIGTELAPGTHYHALFKLAKASLIAAAALSSCCRKKCA